MNHASMKTNKRKDEAAFDHLRKIAARKREAKVKRAEKEYDKRIAAIDSLQADLLDGDPRAKFDHVDSGETTTSDTMVAECLPRDVTFTFRQLMDSIASKYDSVPPGNVVRRHVKRLVGLGELREVKNPQP